MSINDEANVAIVAMALNSGLFWVSLIKPDPVNAGECIGRAWARAQEINDPATRVRAERLVDSARYIIRKKVSP